MVKRITIAAGMLLASVASASSGGETPYAGQEQREIKALSAKEIQGHLNGKGMGFAKTAELNHYPGPMHVLEQAELLQLSEKQKQRTREILAAMKAEARRLGALYVEKERELDRLFASGEIKKETLRSLLEQIGRLQAEIRGVHLQAHLKQKAILTPAQVATYDRRRGYVGGTGPSSHGHSHNH